MDEPLEHFVCAAAVGAIMKRSRLSETESSDSESSDSIVEYTIYHKKNKRARIRIKNYISGTIPNYDDKDFQDHFRLSRTCVEVLLTQLAIRDVPISSGRPAIPILSGVLLMLWTLANQESFRSIGDRFNFAKGHTFTIFISLCKHVYGKLLKQYIQWPSGNKIEATISDFQHLRQNSFPSVIGCVDGTHITIPGPRNDNSYYNRKGYHSMILQGICDANQRFIDIYFGWPGSSHDCRVWQNSFIYKKLAELLPPDIYILGDTAYPISKYVIVPFKDNGHLTPQEKRFNQVLSSTRVVIEQAFGRLKGVFRRLKYLHIHKLENAKYIVGTACTLHNMCIDNNINYIPENDAEAEQVEIIEAGDIQENTSEEGKLRRIQLMNSLGIITR